MQHSAVDLENYARLYVDERLRNAEASRRASQAAGDASLLGRAMDHVRSWLAAMLQGPAGHALAASQPVQLVPVPETSLPASADPYAGMIVLVRGPRETCTLDAA